MKKEKLIDLTIDDSDSEQSDTTYFSTAEGTLSQDDMFFPPLPRTFTSSSDTSHSNLTSSNEDLSSISDPVESEMDTIIRNISRGKPFPRWYFSNIPPQCVSALPKDVNGICVYKMKAGPGEWLKASSDNRHFLIMTTTCEGFTGKVRIRTCMGSYVCRNKDCPFVCTSQNHAPNKVSWRIPRGQRGIRICTICDHIGEREGCGCKKLIEYEPQTSEVTVYHIGNHKCWPKVDTRTQSNEIRKKIGENKLKGSAKEVAISQITKFIDGGDMDGARKECNTWVDRCAVERELQYSKPSHGIDNNSFDAVGIVKRKTDQGDPYYIYEIGNCNYTTEDVCDYVFKTSRRMAEIAISMDQDGPENILQMENVYFDTTHSCVHGFKNNWIVDGASGYATDHASCKYGTAIRKLRRDIMLLYPFQQSVLPCKR